MTEYVTELMARVKTKNPAEPEFHQAVQEVAESLTLVLERHPEYVKAKILERMRFGGCRVDLPPGWMERARQIVDGFPRFLDEFEKLITSNEILIARTQEVGRLSTELAINAGITGPGLRASGVNYDVRKVDDYGIYPRFKFRVPLGEHGSYPVAIRSSSRLAARALPSP